MLNNIITHPTRLSNDPVGMITPPRNPLEGDQVEILVARAVGDLVDFSGGEASR